MRLFLLLSRNRRQMLLQLTGHRERGYRDTTRKCVAGGGGLVPFLKIECTFVSVFRVLVCSFLRRFPEEVQRWGLRHLPVTSPSTLAPKQSTPSDNNTRDQRHVLCHTAVQSTQHPFSATNSIADKFIDQHSPLFAGCRSTLLVLVQAVSPPVLYGR